MVTYLHSNSLDVQQKQCDFASTKDWITGRIRRPISLHNLKIATLVILKCLSQSLSSNWQNTIEIPNARHLLQNASIYCVLPACKKKRAKWLPRLQELLFLLQLFCIYLRGSENFVPLNTRDGKCALLWYKNVVRKLNVPLWKLNLETFVWATVHNLSWVRN